MIDYRHFDIKDITPPYEFGYGLSYTSFDLVAPSLMVTKVVQNPSATPDSEAPIAPGGNPGLYTPLINTSIRVSNTGPIAGATVVQLYMSMLQESVPDATPVKVLRGFEKVYLEPREDLEVRFVVETSC